MDTTSSFLKSVTKRVWSPPQRPFRVCCHDRETRKGITAGTLEELKERVCQALLLTLSAVSLSLVCEDDGTEVDSDEFLITLPDNTMLMALQPGQTWRQQSGSIMPKSQDHNKPRTGRDIARVTFDLYRMSPKDVFGSLSVKATFQGLYSVSANFQCLGPKKVLREALRVASTLLHAAGHLLITSASMIRRIIEGAELWQPQRGEYTASWN
ncbi:Cell death activator CIDE-B Cell death-inducing DFFA-like effector B [Larimichthys crocea]|uniref:Cell death activator CIDE-B Cell death-inducing DFFA-like effector B n=1 Tax=Larimichthys crocea TaxID=215358 RepID=A0A6G0HJL2_LARCR|nr:Cell death activator CIDE-B Cell death-inducing DFFA-like effector B [Larimichthys crocea]